LIANGKIDVNCVTLETILPEDNYRHKGMRRNLVRVLRGKGIADPAVLRAIEKVPRHYFFDPEFVEHAYQDKAFPIGEGQTISQPYTVAVQTQLLEIRPGDRVLEIGTGSGYQCCILVELEAKVYTVEFNRNLYQKTRQFLPLLGYKAQFRWGDGTEGWKDKAPFNKILVTAAAPEIPNALIDQLDRNGILVIPVGGMDHQVMLRIVKDANGEIRQEEHDYFRFVPLVGKYGWGKT
jgi:protein-L-isoaspartate(D-aspartate) O-methyltransferase